MGKETIQVPSEYELTDLIELDEDDHGKPDETKKVVVEYEEE